MAHENEGTPRTVSRRSIMKASALAAGALLLPSSARAGASAASGSLRAEMKAEYDRTIAGLTDELGPRILAGEFRGFRSGDSEKGKVPPLWRFEDEVRRRLAPTNRDALFVLACTDSALDLGANNFRYMAAMAGALDVLRLAAKRGVYRPEPEEEPSLEELNGSSLWSEDDFEPCAEEA